MSASLAGPAPVAFRTSQGRRPRGVVRINGTQADFIEFTVEKRGYFSADTFRVELEAWAQPQGFDIDWWDTAKTVQLEVLVGFLTTQQDVDATPTSLTSLVLGQVDDVEIDHDRGRLIVTGRDLSAKLIDTMTSNRWPNLTSSQIVTMLAQQVGLTAQIASTSDPPAGEYFLDAYNQIAAELPMWDVICGLAKKEGYEVWVTGTTLHFAPPPAESDPNPYVIQTGHDAQGRRWSSATSLKQRRSLTLAQDILVIVKSHSYGTGQSVNAKAERAGAGKVASTSFKIGATVQQYIIRRPNLTQAQAEQIAQQYLADLTQFERVIEVAAEGDPTLTPQRAVRLAGTDTSWDQTYFVDHLTHRFNFARGYGMSFRAKNHSTASDLAI